MLLSKVKKIVKTHEKDLSKRGVSSLATFGSTVRKEATVKSDVDILIDFDSKKGLFVFVGIKLFLEEVLGCKVDLVTKRALHPALKRNILQELDHVF